MNDVPKTVSTLRRASMLARRLATPGWWPRLVERHPVVAFFIVIIWPNALWSIANYVYNEDLIVGRFCQAEPQQLAFLIASAMYTGICWVLGMRVCWQLISPLATYFRARKLGDVPDDVKRRAQRRLVNLPFYQLLVNFFLWMPGGVLFPVVIYFLGGPQFWSPWIAVQFLASFTVSAVVTTFQTFVFLERFLLGYLYPKVFTDIRPVEVPGGIHLSFQQRLLFLWGAVALGPIVVLTLIVSNLLWPRPDLPPESLLPLTIGVVAFGIVTGGIIFWMVGNDVSGWLEKHVIATREIARENFDVRIPGLRSDEWGRLTDSFNDMAKDLGHGKHVRETLGQFVGVDMADEILKNYSELGGRVQDITVMFADIRGFTTRSAGKPPEEVVNLLNQFLTLAVQAIEVNSVGLVNKFLGDGFMALFGVREPPDYHADQAVSSARNLLSRLDALNHELQSQGQPPLRIGIGIHTGPALVGCVGATRRREFTAIGETVNLTQRIEELTKTCGEMLLLSEATRQALQKPMPLKCLGPQDIRGSPEPMVVYTIVAN